MLSRSQRVRHLVNTCQFNLIMPNINSSRTRWKCQDCRDYDLCDGCKTAGQYNHPTHHSFRSIAPPAPPAPTPTTNNRAPHCRSRFRNRRSMRMHGLATCDFCDSLINGTRHKCKDCPGNISIYHF